MKCSICLNFGHDRKYCPLVFCREIVHQTFDAIFTSVHYQKPMDAGDIALTLMMAWHSRLGENSRLSIISDDCFFNMILSGNFIEMETTEYHKNESVIPYNIRSITKLRNSSNMNVAHPVVNHIDEKVYFVSNNRDIMSCDGITHSLLRGIGNTKSFHIVYFEFIDKYSLYILENQKRQNNKYMFLVLEKKSNKQIASCVLDLHHFLTPIVINENKVYLFNIQQRTIIKLHNNTPTVTQELIYNVDSFYYDSKSGYVYFNLKMNRVSRLNISTDDYIDFFIEINGANDLTVFSQTDDLLFLYSLQHIYVIKLTDEFKTYKIIFKQTITNNSKISYNPLIVDNKTFISVIIKGRILIKTTGRDRHITGSNNTTTDEWTTHFACPIITDPIFDEMKLYVYVLTRDKYVHKICTKTGDKLWSIKIQGKIVGYPLCYKGNLYLQTENPSNLVVLSA